MAGFYGGGRWPPVLRATLMVLINFVFTNTVAILLGNLIVYLGVLEPLANALA